MHVLLVLFSPAGEVRRGISMAWYWLKGYTTVGMVKSVPMIVSFMLFFPLLFPPQSSYPIWEDFITKAGKLQSQLR